MKLIKITPAVAKHRTGLKARTTLKLNVTQFSKG